MKKIISVLVVLSFIFLIPTFVFAEDVTPKIPEENVRQFPNGKQIVGTVRKGARLKKISEKDGWTFVSFEGWVYSPSLKTMPPAEQNQNPGEEADFDVLHWNWKQVGKMVRIQGVVKNNSTQYFTSVKILLNVFDPQGNQLGSNYTYLQSEDIKPGQVNGFKVYLRDVTAPADGPEVEFSFEHE